MLTARLFRESLLRDSKQKETDGGHEYDRHPIRKIPSDNVLTHENLAACVGRPIRAQFNLGRKYNFPRLIF